MLTLRKKVVALDVDRTSQQWIVLDGPISVMAAPVSAQKTEWVSPDY